MKNILYTNSCKRFTKSYFARNEGKIRMETRGVIGIDIGTTSTKTVVFTEKEKSLHHMQSITQLFNRM